MPPLTVIAKLKAKSGSEEQFHEELRKLVEPTRPEEGECDGREPRRDARPPTRSTESLFLDLLAIRVVIQTA
jgi:quinol monooxygenase YgiN